MIDVAHTSSLSCSRPRADQVLAEARRGTPDRLGELLESYRNYLRLLAETQIDEKLRVRISPSDLVQDTMLGAYSDFPQFRGHNEGQLLAWLRQILINRLHVVVQQQVLAQKRDVRREISLDDMGPAVPRASVRLEMGGSPADLGPSPSSIAIRNESATALADHLASLTPEHREVIQRRNLQGLSFDEIARQMNRTAGAVRMLWLRAVRQLRKRIAEEKAEL